MNLFFFFTISRRFRQVAMIVRIHLHFSDDRISHFSSPWITILPTKLLRHARLFGCSSQQLLESSEKSIKVDSTRKNIGKFPHRLQTSPPFWCIPARMRTVSSTEKCASTDVPTYGNKFHSKLPEPWRINTAGVSSGIFAGLTKVRPTWTSSTINSTTRLRWSHV